MSGLHHGTIEVVSSSLLVPTLQNCVVRRLMFWFTGQPDHCELRKVGIIMFITLSSVDMFLSEFKN